MTSTIHLQGVKHAHLKFFPTQTPSLRLSAAIALVVAVSTSVAVNASSLYCLGNNCNGNYGETFWLSCGSSAGNYFAVCPADGGTCTVEQGFAQEEADYECALRGH